MKHRTKHIPVRAWLLAGALTFGFGGATTTTATAQTSDLELAEYYYNEGSYEQALLYLEKIYKRNKTNAVYEMYYGSLLAVNNFEDAEDLVQSRLKQRSARATAYVDLGSLYMHFDMREEAMAAFEEALARLEPGRSNAIALANAFIDLNELDMALAVYQKASEVGTVDLAYQIANLQGLRGDYPGMVDAFLDLLVTRPAYYRNVTTSFDRNLRIQDNPDLADMLLGKLIAANQAHPEQDMFTELLVWYYNQLKDFAGAFPHAKALDLRLNETGARIMELGNTASANGDYETAIACFNYVANKGPDNPYFYSARTDALQMRLSALESATPRDQEGIATLAERYRATLRDLGVRAETAMLVKDLAHIEGHYLGQRLEAIERLETLIATPGLYDKIAAACKLELGDIYVLDDAIWDASLLYSQVELDFQDDPLGHEAKFRNARISYFAGDFDWAQSQLDALKASTSKLISNDAIDLSLLITDNYALDTIVEPMALFSAADLHILRNEFDEAWLKMDSILAVWPGHALEDEILFRKSEIALLSGDVDTAMTFLQEIVDLHFDDILGDDALFELARLQEEHYVDLETAASFYERLLFEYPGSLHAVEARRRFRLLRGDDLN
jgi:tetratricopeptide (TPR) repeat protein